MRLGCKKVDSWRLHWTVSRREWGEGTNVILSSSSSVEPTTFSLVSISSRSRECGPYLHRLGAFGGIVIVGVFTVVAVVTATRMCVKNRRGGDSFVVEAFTEVVCGDDVLGGVEATVLFSGGTRRPRSPDSLTVCPKGV